MAREDALALLDTFRLDREEPPDCDLEHVARRFVQLVFPERRFYEEAANRAERSR
ncbi:MAG TPA: hypothetical protein VHG92_05050 [Afifellaceae bacterium]|nr:hypothetical protein [Afifellaceae bacterium]